MTGDAFEYSIKKDIRNNPIVREVDLERHREMWRSTVIGLFLVAVLLFSAWQHFELQQHGYRYEQMLQAATSLSSQLQRSRSYRRSKTIQARYRPVDGPTITKTLSDLYDLKPATVARLKDILLPKRK